MKFRIKLISTTFMTPIEFGKEQEALEIAKFTVESYGLVEKRNSSINKPILKPTIFQHLFFHPFARTSSTSIEAIKKEFHSELKYKVFHPFAFLIPLIALAFLLISNEEKILFIIPPILFCMEIGLIFFMQLTVVKQIQKSIDKKNSEGILDD